MKIAGGLSEGIGSVKSKGGRARCNLYCFWADGGVDCCSTVFAESAVYFMLWHLAWCLVPGNII